MLSNFSYNMWVFLGSFMLVVLLLVIAILISISMHYLHESLKDLKKREGEDKDCQYQFIIYPIMFRAVAADLALRQQIGMIGCFIQY